jgi:hypothetical protein
MNKNFGPRYRNDMEWNHFSCHRRGVWTRGWWYDNPEETTTNHVWTWQTEDQVYNIVGTIATVHPLKFWSSPGRWRSRGTSFTAAGTTRLCHQAEPDQHIYHHWRHESDGLLPRDPQIGRWRWRRRTRSWASGPSPSQFSCWSWHFYFTCSVFWVESAASAN